jgi:hypothetical protein
LKRGFDRSSPPNYARNNENLARDVARKKCLPPFAKQAPFAVFPMERFS